MFSNIFKRFKSPSGMYSWFYFQELVTFYPVIFVVLFFFLVT